jgi:hypothetical protein
MKRTSFTAFGLVGIVVLSISFSSFAIQKDILFETEEPLDVVLAANLKSLKASKSDTIFFSTFIKYKNASGMADSVPVDLRARGNSRRAQCFFPPLWLKIPNGEAKNTPFHGNRSLKLVVPCEDGQYYNDLITKEYIIYKLYEGISPYYFRSRMIKLTLTDTQTKKTKTYTLNAFVIEDVDNVAENYDAKIIESGLILPHLINDTLALKQDFFAFMIGNTDWSNATQHNVRMLDLGEKKYVPVSYDFDYSGFVNAPYAVPYDYLPIDRVTQRLYRGICRSPELTQLVRTGFLQRESKILEIMDRYQSQLPKSEFASARNYLEEFFTILKNDTSFESQMISTCQKYNLIEN